MSDKPKDKPASYYKLALYRDDGTCEISYSLNADPALVEKMIAHSTERDDSPAWNGQGLPPVGMVCRVLWNEARCEYLECKVFGVNEHGQPIIRFEEGYRKYDYIAMPVKSVTGMPVFLPIKSEREKWVESARPFIEPAEDNSHLVVLIYDALKSGKLPTP